MRGSTKLQPRSTGGYVRSEKRERKGPSITDKLETPNTPDPSL